MQKNVIYDKMMKVMKNRNLGISMVNRVGMSVAWLILLALFGASYYFIVKNFNTLPIEFVICWSVFAGIVLILTITRPFIGLYPLQNGMIFVAGLKIHYFKYDQLKKVDLTFTKTDEKHFSAAVKIIDRGGRIYEKDFQKYFSSQKNEAFSQLMYGVKGDTVRQVSEYLEKSDFISVIINN